MMADDIGARPERATAWLRDDCSCSTTDRDGDGCYLSADYTNGRCSHCQGHADHEREAVAAYLASPETAEALARLIDECYQRGLDADEAAPFILAAMRETGR